MSLESLVIWLIVGGVAGLLAGMIMKSGGLSITGNNIIDTIITGIVGAVIGGWLFGALGIQIGSGIVSSIISAVAGAALLIFGLRLIKR